MRVRWMAVLGCLFGVLGLGMSACGEDDDGGGGTTARGNTLTIYSSLPLQGTAREQSQAVINGEKLALKQAGGKAGRFNIKYVSLDDSTAQNPGTADPAQTKANARKAGSDESTIFYLGEFNSGGSIVSIPELNKRGIPQISPSNTYLGLTTDKPSTEPGEPDKYYPTGKRTYARVVPADDIQSAALASAMADDGCKTVAVWNDKTTYGAGLGRLLETAVKKEGMTVESKEGTDKTASNYRSLAANLKGLDCFVWGGVTGENGVQLYKDVAAADPDIKLYGPDGIAEEAFYNPAKDGVPDEVGARVKITVATLPPEELPEGAKFERDYKAEYGPGQPDPYGIYGYEAMKLALDTIEAVGDKGNDREAVRRQLLENTKNRNSVLGTYSIDENGDTTLSDYGLYSIKNGQRVFEKKVTVRGG